MVCRNDRTSSYLVTFRYIAYLKHMMNLVVATPESSGRLSTSIRRFDFWDHLGNLREL